MEGRDYDGEFFTYWRESGVMPLGIQGGCELRRAWVKRQVYG